MNGLDSNLRFNEQTALQQSEENNLPVTSRVLARFNSLPREAKLAYIAGGLGCGASFLTSVVAAGMSHSCADGITDDCRTVLMLHPLAIAFFAASYGLFKIGDACN